MTIFNATQEELDAELASFSGRPIEEIKRMDIHDPAGLRIHVNNELQASSFDFLYKKYNYLDSAHYIKCLSYYTVKRRSGMVYALEKAMSSFNNTTILDFGCGVGSHSIYAAEKGARVDMLDVDGPLYNYAKFRVRARKLSKVTCLPVDAKLPLNYYHAVLCMDVLEHVADPIEKLQAIINALRISGKLLLEVSTVVCPEHGHFAQSVNAWKKHSARLIAKHLQPIQKFIYARVK